MARLIIDDRALPYTEISREFVQSPSSFYYELRELNRGGGRITYKRLEPIVISIPVTIKKGNKKLENVMEEITSIVYGGNRKMQYSFSSRHYIVQCMSIELEEEYETIAIGEMVFVSEIPNSLGKKHEIELTGNKHYQIKGQVDTPWKLRTTFSDSAKSFTFESLFGKIELNFHFQKGDILEIDYSTRELKINGDRKDIGISLRSEWFMLKPGIIPLVTSQDSTISYTERYYI